MTLGIVEADVAGHMIVARLGRDVPPLGSVEVLPVLKRFTKEVRQVVTSFQPVPDMAWLFARSTAKPVSVAVPVLPRSKISL